jgi:hypothetical protein
LTDKDARRSARFSFVVGQTVSTSLRAKRSNPSFPEKERWIASSLQRKIALQFCREFPCANASRLSQATTAEVIAAYATIST